MTHFQALFFGGFLCLLVVLAGFFSLAETSLMALNRYRLRHEARVKKSAASLILKLLARPDRLLGMLLIGNNLSNIVASALATLLAMHFWGDTGVVLSTVILTLVVLIFAEVAPKTVAVLHADKIARAVAWPIYVMLAIFYPFVWFVNVIANGTLGLFGIKVYHRQQETLTRDELHTLVYDTAGKVSRQYRNMLLGVLDLNKFTINDVMIPPHEIQGIDLSESWDVIQKQIAVGGHEWLPCYRDDINQVLGVLHLRELTSLLIAGKPVNKDVLLKLLKEPYFVPEGTPLNMQLSYFQRKRKRLAFVVDEYGQMQGLITLEDILREIVGEFTTSMVASGKIQQQGDDSYLVDGAVKLRELNRHMKANFPIRGPRTVNGLIIEHLESMPKTGICVLIAGHPIEILDVKDNKIVQVRIFPSIL